jgi:hypothetical protein
MTSRTKRESWWFDSHAQVASTATMASAAGARQRRSSRVGFAWEETKMLAAAVERKKWS